jgi:predicted HicB family RNase H-like nuclease
MTQSRRRPGPKSRWGVRSPVSIRWPVEHRALYEAEAAARGVSLNEYVIRRFAELHGLADETGEGMQQQLPLGA